MRVLRTCLILASLGACSAATAEPTPFPTEDPRIAAITVERDDLQRQVQALTEEVGRKTDQVDALTEKVRESPVFVMWDTPLAIDARYQIAGGLPDTFTVRIRFAATTPVRTRIMTLAQYAAWIDGGSAAATTYPPTTSLDVTFHDAEGCAFYVVVLDAEQDSVVTPNFTIQHAVSPRPTGACAD